MSFPDAERIWTRVTITTPIVAADAVAEILGGFCGNGVEVEDRDEPARISGYLSPIVLGNTPEDALETVRNALTTIPPDLLPTPLRVTAEAVPERDWIAVFRAHCRPMREGRIVIKPTWEPWPSPNLPPLPDDLVITLDPGMAFGSGDHATTRACLAALQMLLVPGERVLDYGSGSGILSIAARLLNAAEVLALDYDPVAVEVARANLEMNGIFDRVHVAQADTLGGLASSWDIILANISAPIVCRESANARALLRPGGHFVSAGIPDGREAEVELAIADAGFDLIEHAVAGEWHSFIAHAPGEGAAT